MRRVETVDLGVRVSGRLAVFDLCDRELDGVTPARIVDGPPSLTVTPVGIEPVKAATCSSTPTVFSTGNEAAACDLLSCGAYRFDAQAPAKRDPTARPNAATAPITLLFFSHLSFPLDEVP